MKLFAQPKFWSGIVDLFNKWTEPVGISRESGLRYLQERVVLTILFTGLVLGSFAYIPSVRLCIKEQLWGVAFFDTAIYAMVFVLFFFRRIPFAVRANAIIFSSFLLGLILLTVVGPSASGPVWLFTFPVLAGVIIGVRTSVYALILNLIALIIIGGLIYLDYSAWINPTPHTLERWIVITLNFILLNGVAVMSLAMVLRGLQSSLDHEKSLRLSLEHGIDKQNQADKKLRESEAQYRLLADNVFDVIWTMDLEQRFTYFSPSILKFRGYTPEEAFQLSAEDTLTPESYERAISTIMEEFACEGKPGVSPDRSRTLELEHIRKNGGTIWGELTTSFIRDKKGIVSGVVGVTRDITERKKTEEALRESEKYYRLLTENSTDMIWTATLEGKVTYLSPSVEKLFGYSQEEGIKMSIEDYITKETVEKLMGILANELLLPPEERATNHFVEGEMRTKDGTLINIEINAIWIINELGETVGIQGVTRDITDHKRLEAQLRQAQKMESVGRLAGGVAHDYNNALSVIIGFTEMAIDDVDPDGPLRDDLDEILKAANRAADITRQLLAFARKQTIAPEVLDLNDNVEGMLKMLRRLIGEDIDLAWLPGAGLWPVKMDPSQIDQILANLCVNARDAIDGVGKVTIETDTVVFDAAYCADHPGFVPGEFVLLSLSDNGCGMEKEILDNIFEPFFTTKEVGKGTGLGLSTIYGIAKQNNGFVNVYSEPDKGTTFKIYLPRHEGEAVEKPDESHAQIPTGRGETLLVVEDDLPVLKLARQILEGLGYAVLTSGTTTEAIGMAEEHAGEISLLITDVIMPEMNGRDLAQQLQALYPDLKHIFMSGYTADIIATRGVIDKGEHFIQKPFSRRALATIVRKALDGNK